MMHVGRCAQRGKLDHQVHRASRNTAGNLASPASSLHHCIILSFLFHLDFGRERVYFIAPLRLITMRCNFQSLSEGIHGKNDQKPLVINDTVTCCIFISHKVANIVI